MEMIKGKWYKNTEWLTIAAKFTCRTSSSYCFSEYIGEDGSYRLFNFINSAYDEYIEIPLSEIQQYLPKGHPDKEFVLPEKWCVETTASNVDVLSKWRGNEDLKSGEIYGYLHSDLLWREDIRESTEITFEQFKEYILKTKGMEEKEIIGYKLKDNKYTKNVKALLNAPEFDFQEFEGNRFKFTIALKELRDAGVLDLWFEPVFKEKFKIGDWVTWSSGVTGRIVNHCKSFADSWSLDVKGDTKQYNSCSESGLRLATSEEIKKTLVEEAIKRGFKKGVKTKKHFPEYSDTYINCISTMNHSEADYESKKDALRMGGGIIYHKGRWAEILPNYPQIEINGYKGEFFDWGVKFGCQKYEKEFVIKLAKCIKHNGFKMDYKANVIQIADYYLNKK